MAKENALTILTLFGVSHGFDQLNKTPTRLFQIRIVQIIRTNDRRNKLIDEMRIAQSISS